MRQIFFSILVIICQVGRYVSADPLDWDTAEQISTGSSVGVYAAVSIAPGPDVENAIASWSDQNTSEPYYSIYSNGIWTTGVIPLGASEEASNNVYAATKFNSTDLIVSWGDMHQLRPYYSMYNGSSWTTEEFPLNGSNGSNTDVVVASGPSDGEAAAAWVDASSNQIPYYSIYSGGTWTTNIIPLGASDGVYQNIFISQGPTAGTLMATWGNRTDQAPYYSIYSSGSWEVAGTIPLGGSDGVYIDVHVTQGPNSGEMAVTWTDSNNYVPYYSIYQGGSWTTGVIALGTSSGVWGNVCVTKGPSAGDLVATWKDLGSHLPYYSLYSSGSWSDGAPIPLGTSIGAHNDVCVGLLLDGYTTIAAWGDSTYPHLPYFATLIGQPPSPDKLPPLNGSGLHVKNRFALLIEWYNQLEWTASSSLGVVGYNIRRNGNLIAKDVKELFYRDYNRPKNGVDTYEISSLFEDGTESSTSLEIKVW